jgi:putative membrane protein
MMLHAGSALAPHDLWRAWSVEPAVILPMAVTAALYARGAINASRRSPHGLQRQHRAAVAFGAGWLVLAIALVSPLHQLGGVLFSAHMAQHELLIIIAAPLLVLSRPVVPFLWSIPMNARRVVGGVFAREPVRSIWSVISLPAVATVLHGAAIWAWHAPPLYDASVRSELVHTAQHATFLGTALVFWWAIIFGRGRRAGHGMSVILVFLTAVHTTVLGALLAVSETSWYSAYTLSGTGPWGLTTVEDQQLGGLLMWVPATIGYLVAALALFASWMRESELRVLSREKVTGSTLASGPIALR